MLKNNICFFCANEMNDVKRNHDKINCTHYKCDICGHYTIEWQEGKLFDNDKYASFLYHNNNIISSKNNDKSYLFIGNYNNYNLLIKENHSKNARFSTFEEIENWYPNNFNEKVDRILLSLYQLSNLYGDIIVLDVQSAYSLFFVKRFNNNDFLQNEITYNQYSFISNYMQKYDLIKKHSHFNISISPEGFKRIEELQKYTSNRKQVFVAMRFAKETDELREAIRKGIENKTGYTAFFIDEKYHNNQIVPEILYQIRISKFVIAEFSDNNNGAYYEAGYAAGLGKDVIHVCNKDKFQKKGHFDIKQKSSILYNSIGELPELLEKHIIATIS